MGFLDSLLTGDAIADDVDIVAKLQHIQACLAVAVERKNKAGRAERGCGERASSAAAARGACGGISSFVSAIIL